jgi:hypothetical protein
VRERNPTGIGTRTFDCLAYDSFSCFTPYTFSFPPSAVLLSLEISSALFPVLSSIPVPHASIYF